MILKYFRKIRSLQIHVEKNLPTSNDQYWSIIADKGYEGMGYYIKAVKRKSGINLIGIEFWLKKKIYPQKLSRKNLYGKIKSLWYATISKVKEI